MKLLKYLPLLALIIVFAGFTRMVSAESGSGKFGVSANVGVDLDDDNDGEDSEDRSKSEDDDSRRDGSRDDDSEVRGTFMGGLLKQRGDNSGNEDHKKNATVGVVTTIKDTTITISVKNQDSNNTTTMTVDASKASIWKDNGTATVSSIKTGDTLVVLGTTTGTNIVATKIFAGKIPQLGNWKDKSGVIGTISAIDGSKITVVSKIAAGSKNPTTYTVDATNAKIYSDGELSTMSTLDIGEMIFVEGTITETTVTATIIHDGIFKWRGEKDSFDSTGDPIVGGTVTGINGDTITIKNKSNVTYTIDADSAKFVKRGVDSATISDIEVGDMILVQGAINNNLVTAKLILDHSGKVGMDDDDNDNNDGDNGRHRGFFNRLGVFFGGWFKK